MPTPEEYPMEYPLITNNQRNTIKSNNLDINLMKSMVKEIITINEESMYQQIKNAEQRITKKYMRWFILILIIFIILVMTIVILFSFGIISVN